MRAPVAVRLAVRPRLKLSPEQPAAVRRGFRLPPFALPAAGYWALMAGLTYVFAHLGPHPLEAFASERALPAPPARAPRAVEEPLPAVETASPLESLALGRPEPAPAALEAARPIAPEAPPKPPALTERPAGDTDGAGPKRDASASREAPAPRDVSESGLPNLPLGVAPEFSDSSPAPRRERAADGPRIASLFEPADQTPQAPVPPDAPPRHEGAPRGPAVLSSCEAAVARNGEQLEIGGPRGPADITREAYARILQSGSYLAACRVPDRTVLEICAAVKDGRAVGVTVSTNPRAAELEACVRGAVAGLAFPKSERLDVTHTRFDAVAR